MIRQTNDPEKRILGFITKCVANRRIYLEIDLLIQNAFKFSLIPIEEYDILRGILIVLYTLKYECYTT